MKYNIISSTFQFIGLLIGLLLIIQITNMEQYEALVISALALSFIGLFGNLAHIHTINHLQNILKKHGLWQDEEIKKKELK